MRVRALIAAAVLALSVPPAFAQAPNPHAQAAQVDLEAALNLIEAQHPVGVEGVDPALDARVAAAYADARSLLPRVTTEGDHLAVLKRFSNGLGDRHVVAVARDPGDKARWPGFFVALRDGAWVVMAAENRPDVPPADSVLLACDGKPIDQLAEEVLGRFEADWSVPAQRLKAAPLLFVDRGDRFQQRPSRCFARTPGGERQAYALTWREAPLSQLRRIADTVARSPRAGHRIEAFDRGGSWIRWSAFDDDGATLAAEIERRADELKRAPFLVFDLRGNGGGNSHQMDRAIVALYGAETARAARPQGGTVVWRATPENVQTLERYLDRARRTAGPDSPEARVWAGQLEAMRAAVAERRPLSWPAGASPDPVSPGPAPTPPARPKLIVVTDRWCFSSCLIAVQRLLRLGAVHAGEGTDAGTRYREVRYVDLPSGRIRFGLLQAYATAEAARVGPFEPAVRFEGDMTDDEGVKNAVRQMLR